jgi:hypothetical protein
MIKRAIAIVTALFVASFMALLTLAPSAASASTCTNNCSSGGGGGTNQGCDPATATCFDGAYQFVTLTGDKSSRTTEDFDVPPPPCLWQDIGNAEIGSEVILTFARDLDHMLPEPVVEQLLKELRPVLGQAADLLGKAQAKPPGPPGTWYEIRPNPAVSAAESAGCDQTVMFVWVAAGAAPPVQPLPAVDLAAYAYDHMVLPDPEVTTSPVAKGFVNFATYVWTTWADSLYTGTRARAVTATLGDQSVTVWAQPTITIHVNGPGTPYTNGCTVDGSAYPLGEAPASKPGAPPDCGALWTSTDASATVTATITWTVTYYNGGPAGPVGNQLAVIGTNGTSRVLPINAIEAVN